MLKVLLLLVGGLMLAAEAPPARAGAPPQAADVRHLNELLANLVASVRPAVVQIWTESKPTSSPAIAGFLAGPEGVVLTVDHALPAGLAPERIHVELSDGRHVPARVTGRDPRTDLAVVRMERTRDLPALPLGDSDRVRAGELVLALGHPYRLQGAASLGIVSWMGAPPQEGLPGFDFVYTDAPTNPGNSGGPLVNLAGEVIGVIGWAARRGSTGAAIPSNLVKLVLQQLIADGRVEWGWLGVRVAEVDAEDLERLGLRDARGVLVSDVALGAPAGLAGLRRGDIVVAMDGKRIERARDFERRILATPAGTSVRLVWLRGGDRREVAVTLAPYHEPASTGEPIRSSTFL